MSDSIEKPRLVVGVGASAGGLEAFRQLLSALPDDCGMAFLLVQHLDPTHKSLLVELLAPHTTLSVRDAEQAVRLEANAIYIIRPDTALAVRDGTIELSRPTLHRGVRLPVDHLFRSLARDYGSRSAGIVLTGAGSDGTAGVRAIKAAGGLTIVQHPAQSSQPGMPQAAIDTGVVDLVLPIGEMPEALERFASLPPTARIEPSAQVQEEAPAEVQSNLGEQDFERLIALLNAQAGFDVRVYKPSTVERRVLRRMALSGFDEVEGYLDRLRGDVAEQQQLVRDLLISVTDFFRDPESFKALREVVIAPAVARAKPGSVLRAWVPGCATGEEAYSIAMEFLDAIEDSGQRFELQVFATDIDQEALAVARTGIYPPSIVEHVSDRRLQTYFKPFDGKGFQVRSALRDVVSFAAHDVTKDPPFSRINLVSCRNVLIYLTAQAQSRVLEMLHFALEANGCLFLSTSESTGPQRALFSTVSKSHRIYSKVGQSQPITVARSRNKWTQEQTTGVTTFERSRRGNIVDLARRALMDACLPASVVVAESGEVLFMHGDLERYLRFPRDEGPQFDLSTLLRPEIATRTRGALYKSRRNRESVVAFSSPKRPGNTRVRITTRPAVGAGDGAVVIMFEDVRDGTADATETPEQEAVVEQLEKELQATREDLRTTVEELETSNEELRSSNEESMSMNEELQSANEELEATTEELRSLNEELTTVNGQLREKVEQLEQANDDIQNFFTSTKVATIFLDEQLRIKKVTPAAQELLGVDAGDTGRVIGHIARELLQHELEHEARMVLEHLSTRSRDIRTQDGRWISRQVLPYRTESRRIEGVVVTFVDITELRSATERLGIREAQQATIARLGLHALRELDLQEFMRHVVRDTQLTLDTDFCKILELQPGRQKLLLRAGVGWKPDSLGTVTEDSGSGSPAGYALSHQVPVVVDDLNTEKRFSAPELLREHDVTSGLTCAIGDGEYTYGVLGAFTVEHRAFSHEDANFLQAVANVVGSAVGRHQGRMRLALELGVAHVLTETADLEETLGHLLEQMARELSSAVVAELWWPRDEATLYRRATYVAPPSEERRVLKHFGRETLGSGEGLVGRVFEGGKAIWATDLGEPDLFERAKAAKALGLVSGVALPLHSGTDVTGVIALFSSDRLYADDAYLRSLESVGRSIGTFIARWEIDRAARELAAITESSHDAIVSYRNDGTITRWLPGAEQLFGYTAAEMVGSSIERIVPANQRKALRGVNARIRSGEVVEPYETRRVRKDGGLVEVSERASPVKGADGQIVGVSASDRDISRQKETERRLIEADRQKDEFLAMLGHELRNPLAAIRGATDLLNAAGDGDSILERARSILDRQTAHVAKLLDSLLDVSRINRGQIKLEREVLDLGALCNEVIGDVRERTTDDPRNLVADIPSRPVWMKGDRVRLVQLLDNLLSNAIKYTTDGDTISVSLTTAGRRATLTVRDTGVGIEPDLLPHLFEVFRQSTQTLDRSRGGLGLGLALVRFIAELHGGTAEVRSEGRGHGAEFIVRLPSTRKVRSEVPPEPVAHARAHSILIIEDNVDAAAMLGKVLELSGYEVSIANRGKEGVDLAAEKRPDVVLCDLGLPDGMSGYDVASALRADPRTQDIRLVAVTGYGRPDDKQRAVDAGFDWHLTKPVDMQSLEGALRKVVGTAGPEPRTTPGNRTDPPQE